MSLTQCFVALFLIPGLLVDPAMPAASPENDIFHDQAIAPPASSTHLGTAHQQICKQETKQLITAGMLSGRESDIPETAPIPPAIGVAAGPGLYLIADTLLDALIPENHASGGLIQSAVVDPRSKPMSTDRYDKALIQLKVSDPDRGDAVSALLKNGLPIVNHIFTAAGNILLRASLVVTPEQSHHLLYFHKLESSLRRAPERYAALQQVYGWLTVQEGFLPIIQAIPDMNWREEIASGRGWIRFWLWLAGMDEKASTISTARIIFSMAEHDGQPVARRARKMYNQWLKSAKTYADEFEKPLLSAAQTYRQNEEAAGRKRTTRLFGSHFGGQRKGIEATYPDALLNTFTSRAPMSPPVVVEAGSGIGLMSEWMVARGVSVLGLELDSGYLEQARRRAQLSPWPLMENLGAAHRFKALRASSKPALEYEPADLTKKWPLPSESVDGVVLHRVLSMIADRTQRKRILAETYRVLKPGRRISFLDYIPVQPPEPAGASYQARYDRHARFAEELLRQNHPLASLVRRAAIESGTRFLFLLDPNPDQGFLPAYSTPESWITAIEAGILKVLFLAVHVPRTALEREFALAGFEIEIPLQAHLASRQGEPVPVEGFIAKKPESHSIVNFPVRNKQYESLQRVLSRLSLSPLPDALKGAAAVWNYVLNEPETIDLPTWISMVGHADDAEFFNPAQQRDARHLASLEPAAFDRSIRRFLLSLSRPLEFGRSLAKWLGYLSRSPETLIRGLIPSDEILTPAVFRFAKSEAAGRRVKELAQLAVYRRELLRRWS